MYMCSYYVIDSVVTIQSHFSYTSNTSTEVLIEFYCSKYLYFYINMYAYTVFAVWTAFISTIILITELVRVIKNRFRPETTDIIHRINPKGKKKLLVQISFYRWLYVCFVGRVLLNCAHVNTVTSDNLIVTVSEIFGGAAGVWSILFFFFQLIPKVGPFVTTIQRMLGILITFTFIFICMMIPFSHIFYKLITKTSDCDSDLFASYYEFLHSIFSIMLNIEDIRDFDRSSGTSLLVFHFAFTFFIAILLINFLVALLSSEVTHVVQYKHIVMQIQRLAVERSIEQFTLLKYKSIQRLYKRQQKQNFLCKDDKIFIVVKEKIQGDLSGVYY